ncbi:MAG: hypothetical protein NUV81_01850 [bacterium]|nr:hypothetical protein [bacterium]
MRRKLKHPCFVLKKFSASSFVFPYFNFLLPITKKMERFRCTPFIRNFGFGSFVVLERKNTDI